MKIFGYLALSVMAARTDRKGNKKPINLSKEGKKIFGDVEQILGGMADLFNGLDKIGKPSGKGPAMSIDSSPPARAHARRCGPAAAAPLLHSG